MLLLFVFVFADVNSENIIADKVDVIERNHVYDDQGKLNFTQYIFWDLDFKGDYHVTAWRMEKSSNGDILRPPHKLWRSGFYQMLFFDQSKLRKVSALSFRETWTQFDPEIKDRKIRSINHRRGLSR